MPAPPIGPGSTLAARAIAAVAARSHGGPIDPALRVNVHFHPDRLCHGVPILAAMLRCGVYRSQFETGTSNGGLTAIPGGDRWRWESRIFDRVYDDAPPADRPKYGALNVHRRPTGASPRFGSAHIRLAAHTLPRTTFCYPDSVYEPAQFGTHDRMALVQIAAATAPADPLDAYIEAQVHGPLTLPRDAEALVLDPCYRGTETEAQAAALGVPVEWHTGFRVHADVLCAHPEYRGLEFVALGVQLAQDGWLTPRILGDAARADRHDPQAVKRVWHYLARFGGPGAEAASPG